MFAPLRHPETRVVLCLVALLGASEAGIRLLGVRLSKDIQHLEQFEMLAERISAPVEARETRVLFLGNSLTRLGVDVEVFQQTAAEHNLGPFRVERIMPDNTALAD